MMKKYISLLLITFTMLLTSVPACDSSFKIGQGLIDYLESEAKDVFLRLGDDYTKYMSEAKNLQVYETELTKMKKPILVNRADIYGELELLYGYWVTDGKTIKNVCWSFYTRKPSGDLEVFHDTYATETFVLEIDNRLKKIARYEEMFKWAYICNNELSKLSISSDALRILKEMWESSSNKPVVKRVDANTLSISGNALGLYLDKPNSGEWYYYQDNNTYQPRDKAAWNLFELLNNIPTYEMKRAQCEIDIKSTPYPIPGGKPCSYLSVGKYYSSQYGFSMPTIPIDFKYSKDSEMVLKMFNSYPSLKVYWDTFEAIGFKVVCATLHGQDMMLAPSVVPPSVKDTIILQVK